MAKLPLISSEEVLIKLNENPDFRKAQRKIRPYYDLAIQLIKRRDQLDFSQKELANRAGTFQTRISKIESADLDFRLSTLIEIAEALNEEVNIQLVPFSENDFIEVTGEFREIDNDCTAIKLEASEYTIDQASYSTVNL
jgi:transcriptional regulator with XRE-family HTH domain